MLEVFNTGSNSADANMRFDEKLLMELDPKGLPLLHLYRWSGPCATYGYFIDPSKHLELEKLKKHKLTLARRPTGGGIVFHIWDLAFSFLMPSMHPRFSKKTLENYRFVNEVVKETMREYLHLRDPLELIPQDFVQGADNFCMAKPTIYDVVYKGRKIAGAAQRKRKNGYLHQGTISLALPQIELLKDLLISKNQVLHSMMAYTFAPLGQYWKSEALESMRREIESRLEENLRAKLSMTADI